MTNLTGKLPMMGEDAFREGFLSKSFGNKVISRINRPWKVIMPPGGGTGWVLESEENICLDLTKAKLGWDGTWNIASPPPYLPPWNLYPVQRGTMSVPVTYDHTTGLWTTTGTNHGLELDSELKIALTTAGGGTMASSFSVNTTYYARDIGSDTFKLAATAGGAAITGGTDGNGMVLVYAGIALKINPISTLMQTYDYHSEWQYATWKDKITVTNFTNIFILTKATHCVWMKVEWTSGKMISATIQSGAPWDYTLYYVDADNDCSQGGTFNWYQLLANLKVSSDPGGSANDVKISGSWYKLMCPTTTHLSQGYIHAVGVGGTTDQPGAHYAIVPWYGCVWIGS